MIDSTSIINGIELLVSVIILASLILFLDRKQAARTEELRDEIRNMNERLRGVETNVNHNVNQIEGLRGDVKALDERQRNIEANVNQIEGLRDDVKALDERQRGIEGFVNRIHGSLDTLLYMFRSDGPRPVEQEETGD